MISLFFSSVKIISKTGQIDFYYIMKFICNLSINRVPYNLTTSPFYDHTAHKSDLLILLTYILFKL